MGSGQKFLTQVWSGQFFDAWVRSRQPSLVWIGVGKFPLKIPNFQFFPFGSKKSLRVGSKSTQVKGWFSSYLLRVKSMPGSGQGPSLLWTLSPSDVHVFPIPTLFLHFSAHISTPLCFLWLFLIWITSPYSLHFKPGRCVFLVRGEIPNTPEQQETCSMNWFNCTTNNKELSSAIKLNAKK